MIDEHFFNPEEFAGEWILPSIARSDKDFKRQRYWKGAIWPPLNFLTYLSLRNYSLEKAQKELAEKSLQLFLNEWKRKSYVSENYSSITGTVPFWPVPIFFFYMTFYVLMHFPPIRSS
jgi:glycogen debranching enzyme